MPDDYMDRYRMAYSRLGMTHATDIYQIDVKLVTLTQAAHGIRLDTRAIPSGPISSEEHSAYQQCFSHLTYEGSKGRSRFIDRYIQIVMANATHVYDHMQVCGS